MAEPAAAAARPGEAEHLRQITQIPLFYGRPDKDSLTAGMLIERVEAAAEAAGWNNQRKLSAFFLVLRDKALVWHKSLKLDRFNLRDWDVVRGQFIQDYEPQFTARTHCTNFGELTQRPGETPLNFYGRIVVVMERIEEIARPTSMWWKSKADTKAPNLRVTSRVWPMSATYCLSLVSEMTYA